MATISYTAVLPVPLEEAFSFVSNPNNWPSFFQGMESAKVLDGWGAVGGTAQTANKLLGRTVTSHLTLTEWRHHLDSATGPVKRRGRTWTICGSSRTLMAAPGCGERRP